jgi:threonine/homoserine/homoserine lactone efflux protein
MSAAVATIAAGFGLGLSVAAPLGPVGAAAIREGLERGPAGAALIGLGAATVDFLYLALVYLGVAPLLLRLPWLMTGFYLAGAFLLGRMAWSALVKAWHGGLPASATRRSGNAYLYGLGITLLNPSTIISWLGLGGAFAAAYLVGLDPALALTALLSVFAGSATWFLTLALVTGLARRAAGGRPWVFRAVNAVAGLALGAFALKMLIAAF